MDGQRHEEFARSLFRESNDALFLFDPRDHRLVDINPVALRLTGLSRRSARSLKVWELLSSPDTDGLERLMEAYQRTGFFHSRESYFLKVQEGPPIPVSVSVSRIHTKPDPLGLATVRDIRESRRALEGLERFFSLSPALFAIMERNEHGLRFVKLNAAWVSLLGRETAALLTTPPLELVHPDDRDSTRDAFNSLAHGEASGFRHRLQHQDGSYRWISWNASAVDDRIYAVGRDITDEQRLQELAIEKEAAEAASRAKSEFLALVSHELRTPLTTILASTDLMMLDPYIGRAPSERLEDLRMIRQSGQHLLSLIDDILDLSVIDAGRLRIESRPCSLIDVATGLIRSMRKPAEAKGLSLEFHTQGEIPAQIVIDALRLRQILFNLLGNAINYTESGGVSLLLEGPTDVAAPVLTFRVTDTGPGISEQEQSHLFEPFYQPPRGIRASRSGTGLGLSISRRLADQLGGRLDLETRLGQGSTFTLRLPFSLLPESSRVPRTPTEPAPRPSPESNGPVGPIAGRILLVEDHPANQRVIALRLKLSGADVEVADDGRTALDLTISHRERGSPFDVILLDMQMPVLDGYEAARRLRERGVSTPIIALTAHASEEDREECLRCGCDAYLSKPFEWDRLLALIVDLAPRANQPDRSDAPTDDGVNSAAEPKQGATR
jgi:PAS domain S-box-containing protein